MSNNDILILVKEIDIKLALTTDPFEVAKLKQLREKILNGRSWSMKIYAIGYEKINEKYRFYVYDCKFFSSRKQVDESFYIELKSTFFIAGKNNKSFSGIYFDKGI